MRGDCFHSDAACRDGWLRRETSPSRPSNLVTIEEIVCDVRSRGDAALVEWSKKFDGTTASSPQRAVAYGDIPTSAVLAAAESVRTWHAAQRPADLTLEVSPGVTLERRWTPLRSIGIYVPTGLVSSLIMAGCAGPGRRREYFVVCTPPKGSATVAAAAALLGIVEVWAIGGAQAIAALAYGSESIAPVDKIFGPGGGAVNTAKLLVSRDVAIDLPPDRVRSWWSRTSATTGPSSNKNSTPRWSTVLICAAHVVGRRHVDVARRSRRVRRRARRCWAFEPNRWLTVTATPERVFVGDLYRRCRPVTTPRVAITSCRRAVGPSRPAVSVSKPS